MGIVIALLMLIAAAFLLRSEWEKVQLSKIEYTVKTDKCTPKTFVFISDLHDYLPVRHDMEKITRMIDGAGPDAVLIGGDMITMSKSAKPGSPAVTEWALKLSGELSKKYPVYYAEGNHETRFLEKNPEGYADFVSELLSMGVKYIPENSLSFEDVVISGVRVPAQCYKPILFKSPEEIRLPDGYLKESLEGFDRDKFNILLMHSPRYLHEASELGVDLVLSGHMHGGTIRLPDGSGLMTPQYQFLVKECSGEFTEGGTRMIVNRGLGTHSIKIRFNDIPEVSVIHIEN
ncbi:MAG: metallophosphoesterase [Eubacteriales bacterium]|nr:metallophosphoesterase [Eubacteriales bacterium]